MGGCVVIPYDHQRLQSLHINWYSIGAALHRLSVVNMVIPGAVPETNSIISSETQRMGVRVNIVSMIVGSTGFETTPVGCSLKAIVEHNTVSLQSSLKSLSSPPKSPSIGTIARLEEITSASLT